MNGAVLSFPLEPGHSVAFADEYGRHKGTDIFADEGTPVVAVDAGLLRFGTDPLGGQVATITMDDGTRYYYAHLSAYEGQSGRRVVAGERIAYVGHTGNAAHTSPHLHFEVHPLGGEPVDPFPLLSVVAPPGAAKPSGPRAAQASAATGDDWSGLFWIGVLWWLSKRRR